MKAKRLTKQKYLTDPEYEQLHKRVVQLLEVEGERRNALIILLALHTGARATEILNIRPHDLDHAKHSVDIRGLKGSNDREIPLPVWLFSRLVAEAEGTGKMTPIFSITYKRLFQVWHSLRTVNKKFHALRHTFAVRTLQRTNNIRLVQICLGHASINSTMVYASYLMEVDTMRGLLEA